jgi:hypothetical protein
MVEFSSPLGDFFKSLVGDGTNEYCATGRYECGAAGVVFDTRDESGLDGCNADANLCECDVPPTTARAVVSDLFTNCVLSAPVTIPVLLLLPGAYRLFHRLAKFEAGPDVDVESAVLDEVALFDCCTTIVGIGSGRTSDDCCVELDVADDVVESLESFELNVLCKFRYFQLCEEEIAAFTFAEFMDPDVESTEGIVYLFLLR